MCAAAAQEAGEEHSSAAARDQRAAPAASPTDEDEPAPNNHTAVEGEPAADPCASPEDLGQAWVDWLNRRVHSTVCHSAMWFDGFFGDDRVYDEYAHTGGRVSTHLTWTQYDGFDPQLRFRVQANLPNVDRRVHAFVGRETRDEYLTDTSDRSNPGGSLARFDEEEELLFGLGYAPQRGEYDRISFSLGANMSWPPEPYVKATYRYLHMFSDQALIRWRQTVFWELEDQLGTTTNVDLERRLGDPFLLRWTNTGTISGITEGVEWWTTLTLYHTLSTRRALAYTLWVSGRSEAPVDLQEYGVRVVYRQRIARDWLFLDVGPIVAWPRWEVGEVRETSWGALVGVEMLFGERRW